MTASIWATSRRDEVININIEYSEPKRKGWAINRNIDARSAIDPPHPWRTLSLHGQPSRGDSRTVARFPSP